MEHELGLLFQDDVQKIMDTFSACFNINIHLYSPSGNLLAAGLNRPICSYCSLLQNKLYSLDRCIQCDKAHFQEAKNKQQLIAYQCPAGLMETIKPVYFRDKLAGYVMFGQIKTTKKMPEQVKKDWRRKFGTAELEKAFSRNAFTSEKDFNNIVALFSILVDYIVSKQMIVLKSNALVEEVLSFIEKNCSRKVTLAEVARHVNKSQSSVSHLFRQAFGKTLKTVMIELKLEKVEKLLRDDPGMTISRAALMAGYEDQFYFSRVYRKYRRVSPLEFVRNIRQTVRG
jgi:AraC-like DNA-binding protein